MAHDWIYRRKEFKRTMKRIFKSVKDFTKREWFLFVTVAAITIIIIIFEVL